MRETLIKCARGAAIFLLVVGLAVPSIGYAGRGDEDDKSNPGKKEEERSEQFRSQRDDRQVTGQVLEINSLLDPPEMVIANTDGKVKVRMLTTDLIGKNSVRLGDHVTLIGEKISEVEFEAQEMSVDGHLGDDPDEEEDD
jgi:hypothetical protein